MRKLSAYGPSVVVLIAAAVVLLLGPQAVQMITYQQTRTRIVQARHSLEAGGSVLEQLNQAYRDIASVVEPSVVHVSAQYFERDAVGRMMPRLSTGSGWVYDEHGHVVTNEHVVRAAQRIEVQLYNGQIREATILGSDPSTDIAVLKIAPGRLHPATLAHVDESVDQGDLVFAFGSPFDFRFSMSSGVVSGKGRSVGVLRDESGRRLGYENFIQVDAAINPGNSGGPLTDYRGRVIGMNTAIATGRQDQIGGFDEGQFGGIGLAIPIEMIQPAVSQIIRNGFVEKGYMGVSLAEMDAATAQHMGFMGEGVRIIEVVTNTPAAAAGLQANDIITHVGNRTVKSNQQLTAMISSMMPGETARLNVWRWNRGTGGGGETHELSVKLARLDTLRGYGVVPHDQSKDDIAAIGIKRMATATPALAQRFNAKFVPGVTLLELVPESALAKSLPLGSTIIEVYQQRVQNVDEFIAALREYNLLLEVHATAVLPDGSGRSIRLQVMRSER